MKQDLLQKKSFWKFYEVRSERGISNDADSGPPRYILVTSQTLLLRLALAILWIRMLPQNLFESILATSHLLLCALPTLIFTILCTLDVKVCIQLVYFSFQKKSFQDHQIQVNLCQKLLFLHQLTHNMTTDCALNYKLITWKFLAQNMGRTCCVQTLFLTFRTISVHNMFSKKKSFWQKFTYKEKQQFESAKKW